MVSIEFVPRSSKFQEFNTVVAADSMVSETVKLIGQKHHIDPHKISISKKENDKYIPLEIYKSYDENELPQGGTIKLYIGELHGDDTHDDQY